MNQGNTLMICITTVVITFMILVSHCHLEETRIRNNAILQIEKGTRDGSKSNVR